MTITLLYSLSTEAIVALSAAVYQTTESIGSISVCVTLTNVRGDNIDRTVSATLSIIDGPKAGV